MSLQLDCLRQRLRPIEQAVKPGSYAGQAAVMALITDHPQTPELVFVLRARHLRAHAGEVGFPGGKWEVQDADLLATALRETREETDLATSHIQLLGACTPRATLSGTRVTPFVGRIPQDVEMTPDLSELEAIFRVPLGWFTPDNQLRIDAFHHRGGLARIPAYTYQGYEIWGFTAAVTQEILSCSNDKTLAPVQGGKH